MSFHEVDFWFSIIYKDRTFTLSNHYFQVQKMEPAFS